MFREVLYSEQENCVPFPVRYLFDIFDRLAEHNNNTDHVHLWRVNCFISGFWCSLIQKPDNLLDVRSLTAVEHSLQSVAQALMDAASHDRSRTRNGTQHEQKRPDQKPNIFERHIKDYHGYTSTFFEKCDSKRMLVF